MNIKERKTGGLRWRCLILLIIGTFFAAVLFVSSRGSKAEDSLTVMETEEIAFIKPDEQTNALDTFNGNGQETYHQICTYIDQGDVRSAVDTLLAEQSGWEVHARLEQENPELLERILVEAACFCNEDGELFQIVDLRLKGYFSDKMFSQYWERVWGVVPAVSAENTAYDGYLYHELLNWYERGGDVIRQIVDLRYLGMIDNELYSALVKVWNADPMDDADSKNYIPQYGMQLSQDENEMIRTWMGYVDEGESRKAAQMMLSGDITETVYRWLRKNDADLTDTVLAQAMYELAADGAYEQIAGLILGGYVSDNCFAKYWSLLEFTPEEKERFDGEIQSSNLYFVYEMERICEFTKDASLVQKLWEKNLIDVDLYDLLVSRVGGWEAE